MGGEGKYTKRSSTPRFFLLLLRRPLRQAHLYHPDVPIPKHSGQQAKVTLIRVYARGLVELEARSYAPVVAEGELQVGRGRGGGARGVVGGEAPDLDAGGARGALECGRCFAGGGGRPWGCGGGGEGAVVFGGEEEVLAACGCGCEYSGGI